MKTRYEKFITDYDFFTDRVHDIIDLKEKMTGKITTASISDIEFEEDLIYVRMEEYSYHGQGERYTETLTIDELFMDLDKFKIKIEKQVKEEKIAKEKKELQKKNREKNRKEKEERKEFERLSKKYKN